jgi:hypothetical protein
LELKGLLFLQICTYFDNIYSNHSSKKQESLSSEFANMRITNLRSHCGGAYIANLWEWGGQENTGAYLFTQNRPVWAYPIHNLLDKNKVTIFFQGHDHIWVHQN